MKTNTPTMTVSEALWITLTRIYKNNPIARKMITDKGYIIEMSTEHPAGGRTVVKAVYNPKTEKRIRANNPRTKYRSQYNRSEWYGVLLFPNYDYYYWGYSDELQRYGLRTNNFCINSDARAKNVDLERFLDTPINKEAIAAYRIEIHEDITGKKEAYHDFIREKKNLTEQKTHAETLKEELQDLAERIERNTTAMCQTQAILNDMRAKLGLKSQDYYEGRRYL